MRTRAEMNYFSLQGFLASKQIEQPLVILSLMRLNQVSITREVLRKYDSGKDLTRPTFETPMGHSPPSKDRNNMTRF